MSTTFLRRGQFELSCARMRDQRDVAFACSGPRTLRSRRNGRSGTDIRISGSNEDQADDQSEAGMPIKCNMSCHPSVAKLNQLLRPALHFNQLAVELELGAAAIIYPNTARVIPPRPAIVTGRIADLPCEDNPVSSVSLAVVAAAVV